MPVDPPLPAVPSLTLAAADQWCAAQVRRRLETRWLALLPVGVFVLATASGDSCTTPADCQEPWTVTAALLVLTVELILLLVRPRALFLVPATAAGLLWLLPGALPSEPVLWAVLVSHGVLAAALLQVELGRRSARQQLDLLMGPPVPYPWPADRSPIESHRPWIRRVLAGLLLASVPVIALLASAGRSDHEQRAAAATAVQGTVLATDADGLTAEVGYRLPGGGEQTARLDIWWDYTPKVGDQLRLVTDGQGFVQVAGDYYDSGGWHYLAGLAAVCATLLLVSASAGTHRRRRLHAEGAPAMRVLVQPDATGRTLLVRPVDAARAEPALWRLRPRDAYLWCPDTENGPAWLPGHEVADDETADVVQPVRPAPAWLYQGPDGPYAQLLVFRPPLPGARWVAVVTRPQPVPTGRRQPDRDSFPALTEKVLAAAPAGPPEAARRVEMPGLLRCAAGPLLAVLMGWLLLALDGSGWWDGLVRPLGSGVLVLVATTAAVGWQVAFDRDGLTVALALRAYRYEWDDVSGAVVHRNRLLIRLRNGDELSVGAWAARLLGRHFGGPFAPQAVAETITVLAHRPERRPTEALSGPPLGSPHLLINRICLTGYVLFVLGHYLL